MKNIKKIIGLLVVMILCVSIVNAQDRTSVRVEFKKALWTCPVCQVEEVEDRPVNGGASYEHTCINGHIFNQSGPNMKEYNGALSYPKDTFDSVKQEDIDTEKQTRMDKWIYDIKHPVPYVEPDNETLEKLILEKQEEIKRLQDQIDAQK